MAESKNKGLPQIELIPKKKKPKSSRDTTTQSLLRRLKKVPQRTIKEQDPERQRIALEKRRATITKKIQENPNYYQDIAAKRKKSISKPSQKVSQKTSQRAPQQTPPMEQVSVIEGAPTLTSRFDKLVSRVSKLEDISKLKKMIYNRNYRIRKHYEKEHPDYAKNKNIVMFPPIEDLRLITKSTFNRLGKIKDPDKLIEELRKIIINTTRRRNVPKTTGDFSNREQDYLENGVNALKEALSHWGDNSLRTKIQTALQNANFNILDMHAIFGATPSYWAISEGYYYAVADFDDFMEEIYKVIERGGTKLTDIEKNSLADRLFANDPRVYSN